MSRRRPAKSSVPNSSSKDSGRYAARSGRQTRFASSIRGYAACGVDQIIFVSQSGRNQHEHICESLELFGKEVLPEFGEKADEIETAKLERLGPAIEAALARRQPPKVAPEYTISAAMQA